MRDSLADAREFHLAEWRVIPAAGLLQCGQVNRRVPPRLIRLLLVLVSRSRQVVSKKEIVDRVWDHEDASDDSVSACVYQLRKALGCDSTCPRYIETIPKRGYRLLVDAQFHADDGTTAAAPMPPALSPPSPGSRGVSSAHRAHRAAAIGFPADAVEAFSRGRALIASQRPRNLLQAKLYFEHALALEPRFASAHAGLAIIYVALHYNQHAGASWAEHARCNARAALEIDAMLGETHAAQALVLGFVDGDFAAADAEYRTTFELRPDLVLARRRYALLLAAMQRPEEALQQLAEATRYDPLNVSAQHENAHVFFMLRRFERAAEELLKVLSRDPRSWTAYSKLAFIHWLRGNSAELHATYRAAANACDTQDLLARIDQAFATEGAVGLYATVASHLEGRNPEHRFHLPELIATYTAAGDHGRALRLLQDGCARRVPHVLWLLRSPYVDPLRREPGFRSLATRHGVPSHSHVVDLGTDSTQLRA